LCHHCRWTQERAINVKLFYYDDKVPATYKPKGFRDATYEKHGFFAAPPLKIQLGKVATVRFSNSLRTIVLTHG
jgi:hypothetical protein